MLFPKNSVCCSGKKNKNKKKKTFFVHLSSVVSPLLSFLFRCNVHLCCYSCIMACSVACHLIYLRLNVYFYVRDMCLNFNYCCDLLFSVCVFHLQQRQRLLWDQQTGICFRKKQDQQERILAFIYLFIVLCLQSNNNIEKKIFTNLRGENTSKLKM